VVAFKPVADGAPLGKADGQPAKVLKIDETADLALLKVEKTPADVHPLPLGDSSQLQVGADVHAIGHPEGETWTYTRGVVSQVRRAYEWTLDEDKLPHEATVIQTQTPINPGNSGGPLLDGRGALIGVNTLVTRGAEGVNFAVSVEDVKSFLARAHDRAPARDKAAACEPKDIEEYDQKDPRAHVVTVDTDCDGKADSAWFTPKNRREPELYMTELTDKGTYASVYYDQDRDGETDWALYDSDGDGAYDYRGDFRKGEDQPYRWEKLAK
jgi:S1-C subfamily serine protease